MSAPQDTSSNRQEIERAIESIRTVIQVSLLCGIVLSSSLFAYVYKQNRDIKLQNAQMYAYYQEYQTNVLPRVEIARTNLEAFARSNPSLNPLMQKYFSGGKTNSPSK